jgi:hypothetical protein
MVRFSICPLHDGGTACMVTSGTIVDLETKLNQLKETRGMHGSPVQNSSVSSDPSPSLLRALQHAAAAR